MKKVKTTCPLMFALFWILADNILWYGKVVEAVAKGDKQTQAIIEFNDMVMADPRVENVILPIRDGINIIRVK